MKYFVILRQFIVQKINKSILNTVTFYLEDNYNEEVDFNQKSLSLTSQLIKNRISKNLKLVVVALVKNFFLVPKTLLVK